jgi:hypothetical protein
MKRQLIEHSLQSHTVRANPNSSLAVVAMGSPRWITVCALPTALIQRKGHRIAQSKSFPPAILM